MKRLGALHFVIGVLALVVGLAVGGLAPRAEVRALRAQLDEAGECESSSAGAEIANVFRGRPWDGDKPAPKKKVTKFDPDNPPPDAGPMPEDGIVIEIGNDDGEDFEPETLEQGLDFAREAMELRYAQARAALLEDADPSEEQLAEIDGALERMNDGLMELANDLVDQVAEDGEPDRRDTMLFAAETLDLVLSTEDDLRASLSEEQLGALQDESIDPLSYVDPSIVDVLGQLDGLGN